MFAALGQSALGYVRHTTFRGPLIHHLGLIGGALGCLVCFLTCPARHWLFRPYVHMMLFLFSFLQVRELKLRILPNSFSSITLLDYFHCHSLHVRGHPLFRFVDA